MRVCGGVSFLRCRALYWLEAAARTQTALCHSSGKTPWCECFYTEFAFAFCVLLSSCRTQRSRHFITHDHTHARAEFDLHTKLMQNIISTQPITSLGCMQPESCGCPTHATAFTGRQRHNSDAHAARMRSCQCCSSVSSVSFPPNSLPVPLVKQHNNCDNERELTSLPDAVSHSFRELE